MTFENENIDQANVQIVLDKGVHLVLTRLPYNVRLALDCAVQTGTLGHLPKDGKLPEAFFTLDSRDRAVEERRASNK